MWRLRERADEGRVGLAEDLREAEGLVRLRGGEGAKRLVKVRGCEGVEVSSARRGRGQRQGVSSRAVLAGAKDGARGQCMWLGACVFG